MKMKYLLLLLALGGCEKDLELQRINKSQELVQFKILVREHPVSNIQDTLRIINSQKDFFMYDTISYREEFKYEPQEQTTYTVIKDMGSFTFTSNDTVYVDILKFSGIDYRRNIHLPRTPKLIVGEPDSLFLRYDYEMYEVL